MFVQLCMARGKSQGQVDRSHLPLKSLQLPSPSNMNLMIYKRASRVSMLIVLSVSDLTQERLIDSRTS